MTSRLAPPPDEVQPNLAVAAQRLAPWGFLADPDLPDRPGPASLIVALRERPTLRHYDPEVVEFWSTEDGRGAHETITRKTRVPLSIGVRDPDHRSSRRVERLLQLRRSLRRGRAR